MRASDVSLGVYSSSSQWVPIMGGTTQFSNLPLWYAHWDYSYSSCTSDSNLLEAGQACDEAILPLDLTRTVIKL
jgi:hypothetical protein